MPGNFDSALADFQSFARSVSPEFAAGVDRIVQVNYISQLGDALDPVVITPAKTINPVMNTVDSIGSFIDGLGKTYINSVTTYYNAKAQLANLKTAAKGSLVTQAVVGASGSTAGVNNGLLILGGLGLVAVLMMRGK